MTTLVPVDGSQSSLEALKYAARRRPQGDLLILHVAPSGRQADLERGRFLLEDGARACRDIAQELRVQTRLEVGDPRAKVQQVAEAAGCDLVVMGAHGVNALPHVDQVGREASEITEDFHRPVVLVLPTGKGIRLPTAEAEEDLDAAASI
ncbi:MAG TPA: universal stress protein [Armatimonadota bacterium]|nr:universal stress protein [Armatimonadota bacterium]